MKPDKAARIDEPLASIDATRLHIPCCLHDTSTTAARDPILRALERHADQEHVRPKHTRGRYLLASDPHAAVILFRSQHWDSVTFLRDDKRLAAVQMEVDPAADHTIRPEAVGDICARALRLITLAADPVHDYIAVSGCLWRMLDASLSARGISPPRKYDVSLPGPSWDAHLVNSPYVLSHNRDAPLDPQLIHALRTLLPPTYSIRMVQARVPTLSIGPHIMTVKPRSEMMEILREMASWPTIDPTPPISRP